ncbi:MAG: type I-E CRISPR-associated endoribonuclease Cas2e [Sandaracinaceae bacterium]|nr:type I-E CRISPR-associated endoribonuclease Cas2e [Sandaracinaceae bacterium]
MSMTVVVTRNVRGRFRGFLASVMCEIGPGVYTAPRMTKGIRERVWSVLEGWFKHGEDALIVMTWPDNALPGGQEIRVLGETSPELHGEAHRPLKRELVQVDGVYLVRTPLTKAELIKLGVPDPDLPF